MDACDEDRIGEVGFDVGETPFERLQEGCDEPSQPTDAFSIHGSGTICQLIR